MDETMNMLDRAYMDTLQAVTDAKTDSEEARWQIQKLNELLNQKTTMMQSENENTRAVVELHMKEKQLKDDWKDRIIKNVLDGVSIILPIAVSSYWMAKGLRFEETGTFTSRTGQWVSQHLRLFRK